MIAEYLAVNLLTTFTDFNDCVDMQVNHVVIIYRKNL